VVYHKVAWPPFVCDARLRCAAVATDDDALLEACRRGDRAAWSELFGRYHRLVRAIAGSYGLRGDDADEVVQLVFTIVFNQLDRFRPGTRMPAWLSSVTRRHVWRMLESRRRELVVADAGAQLSHRDVDETVDRDASRDWLLAGLARLPAGCRRLLEALYLRGPRSYAEVAEELDIPVGSIGPTRSRCLERLRRLLVADAPDPRKAVSHG
jgi:RNA polymerase sigma factor (sigma-70 family)